LYLRLLASIVSDPGRGFPVSMLEPSTDVSCILCPQNIFSKIAEIGLIKFLE